jgi:hypothetical protein
VACTFAVTNPGGFVPPTDAPLFPALNNRVD